MFEIKVNVQLSATPELIQAIMIIAGIAGKTTSMEVPRGLGKSEPLLPSRDEENAPIVQKSETVEEPQQPDVVGAGESLPSLSVDFTYTEAELAEYPTADLDAFLRKCFGIDHTKYPGKGTNAKLRRLVIDAIAEHKDSAGAGPSDDEEVTDPAPAETAKVQSGDMPKITAELLRGLMVPRIQNKDTKTDALNALKETGYGSITELCEAQDTERMEEFYLALTAIKVK